ncbi:hypothetical protein FLP41_07635 [Paracoccus marcusii]|uniref:hypothetical protein n=1 Tax=Paracoccus marcusii TaxID=59779 RepID=UPI002ED31BE7|nr:hypothetical protein FLP41_07635 [Paracoccus marcusii]
MTGAPKVRSMQIIAELEAPRARSIAGPLDGSIRRGRCGSAWRSGRLGWKRQGGCA